MRACELKPLDENRYRERKFIRDSSSGYGALGLEQPTAEVEAVEAAGGELPPSGF